MRSSIAYEPGCHDLGKITWGVIKCDSWNHFLYSPVLVQDWALCWGPRYYKENLSKAAPGCPHHNWNIGKPVSDVSIFRLDLKTGNDLAFLILTGRQALTTQLQSIITPSSVCEEPPTACWGPARKLTWVNGLEENMRWQEAEMPFSSKSTWKGCLER